jgi:hypothetical protein
MTISVRVKTKQNIKTTVASGVVMARTLDELLDVDLSGVHDKYLIMYDASAKKYVAVNPDMILSAATTDPISPGLPADYLEKMGSDLDNQIDMDAGTF